MASSSATIPSKKGEETMRLIDADKLYDWIRTECNPYGKPTIDFESGNRMLDMVKRMPIAFDKEKVREELKEEGCIIDDEKGNRAVEIVEKGGI